jgi:hypothetical protein
MPPDVGIFAVGCPSGDNKLSEQVYLKSEADDERMKELRKRIV